MWAAGAHELGEGMGVYFIAQRLVWDEIIGPLNLKGLLQSSHSENDGPTNVPHFVGFPSWYRAEPRLNAESPQVPVQSSCCNTHSLRPLTAVPACLATAPGAARTALVVTCWTNVVIISVFSRFCVHLFGL